MFGITHSKTNQLLKTIWYKTSEQSKKYWYWNMEIEKQPVKVSSTCKSCKIWETRKIISNIPLDKVR